MNYRDLTSAGTFMDTTSCHHLASTSMGVLMGKYYQGFIDFEVDETSSCQSTIPLRFSTKLMWMKVASTNHDPRVVCT